MFLSRGKYALRCGALCAAHYVRPLYTVRCSSHCGCLVADVSLCCHTARLVVCHYALCTLPSTLRALLRTALLPRSDSQARAPKSSCRVKIIRRAAPPRRQKPFLLYAPSPTLSRIPAKQTSFPAFFGTLQKKRLRRGTMPLLFLDKMPKNLYNDILLYYQTAAAFPGSSGKGHEPSRMPRRNNTMPENRSGCRIRRTACAMRRERMS